MFRLALFLSYAITVANAWSPTNSYVPGKVDCPDVGSLIREADSLNSDEADWVTERHKITDPALIDYFGRLNLTDFDAEEFLGNVSLNIALAFSGGGYRAMLAGAGQFAALDNRTINSTDPGHLGGLVQASTYLAGLSGGNWLVGSIVLNNFTTVQDLQGDDDLWDLEHSIINPGGINIFSTASYWDGIKDDVEDKMDAGFNGSLTDIWGRALSQQFIGLKDGGPALTWDDIRTFPVFENHSMPFPIVVADGRAPDSKILALNSTVFEFTPFELGSWDPSLNAFTDVKYLGTNVSNGVSNGTCVAGFDNAGFTLGTSSSLFNQFILQLNSSGVSGVLYDLAQDILQDLEEDNDDIAIYTPNPFADVNTTTSSIRNAEYLSLVDGGEDNQNIPLLPLIQPHRNIDVIFAFDNSADTNNSWPNGSSLVHTYERQFVQQGADEIFPYVPDYETFINLELTKTPTFFGCSASNLTSLYNSSSSNNFVPPLIVYIANYPYTYFGNTSTFKLSYEKDEVAGLINNGYDVTTQLNGTIDPEWPACLGCAIIQRETERRGISQTEQCQQCFQRYCWNGTVDSSEVDINGPLYNPTLLDESVSNSSSDSSASGSVSAQSTGSATGSSSGGKGNGSNIRQVSVWMILFSMILSLQL